MEQETGALATEDRWTPLEAGVLTRLTTWAADVSPWRLLAVLAAVRVALVGVATTPNLDQWLLLANDPFGDPPLGEPFRYVPGSPVGPLLADALGISSRTGYAALHALLLIASVCALLHVGRRVIGDDRTKVAVVVLFASPLSNVLLGWLGQPDAITIGALSALGLGLVDRAPTRGGALVVAGGVLLGANSFEQGAVGLGIAVLVLAADARRALPRVGLAAAGLAVGRGLQAWYLAASDVVHQSRVDYATDVPSEPFIANLPSTLFSFYGAAWLIVLVLARRRIAEGQAARLGTFGAGAAAVLMALLTLDETRVAALVLWPGTLVGIALALPAVLDRRRWSIVALTALAGAVIPPVVVWDGEPLLSNWAFHVL